MFRVDPIERWKGKFRKPASQLAGTVGIRVGRVNGWYRRGILKMEGSGMKIGMGWWRGGEIDVRVDGELDQAPGTEE